MSTQPNQPVKTFRSGGISASVWRNDVVQNGQTVVNHSVTLQKRYRDRRTGEWRDSGTFFMSDLPRVQLVMRKAYEYLALTAVEEDTSQVPI